MSSQLETVFETLMLVPWMATAGASVVKELAMRSQIRQLSQGTTVSWRGQPLHHLIVVAQGGLVTSQTNHEGKQHVAGHMTRGMVFGLVPLLDELPAIQDAIVLEASQVVLVPRDALLDQMQKSQNLMNGAFKLLCARSRHLYELLADQSLQSIQAKVARQLLQLATEYSSRTPEAGEHPSIGLTQRHIADMLGITRQSLNAELKSLEKAGLIALAYSRIRLLDLAALKKISASGSVSLH